MVIKARKCPKCKLEMKLGQHNIPTKKECYIQLHWECKRCVDHTTIVSVLIEDVEQ